jgi:hypothetical protein
MSSASGAMTGAVTGWRGGEQAISPLSRNQMYALNWAYFDGSAFNAAWKRQGVFKNQRVYNDTRLVFKHVASIGTFYQSLVYQGPLATDGKRLPDGSLGAIPIDPQTGDKKQDEAIRAAIAEEWSRWNWQHTMTLRPLYTSVLGDVLTEIRDDPSRHSVQPEHIWPGHVVDLVLDSVGNVKAYVLEYRTTIIENGQEQTILFRKEVDKASFRYYRDDRPWTEADRHGDAEQENPYGFVPAIWDRHKVVWDTATGTISPRGLSAFEDSRQALNELNSMLSHAMDYQSKQFAAPIGVRGTSGSAQFTPEQREKLRLYELGENGGFDVLQFDIGQTLELLKWIKDGILEENPEASFYHDLREMTSLTGPAVERALGDAVSRVNLARAGQDPNTVKLHQMATAIAGYRLSRGDWENPTPRDKVFAPFDLDSYKDGALDMTILARPVVPMNAAERLQMALDFERVQYVDTWVDLGLDETEAEKRVKARQETATVADAGLF